MTPHVWGLMQEFPPNDPKSTYWFWMFQWWTVGYNHQALKLSSFTFPISNLESAERRTARLASPYLSSKPTTSFWRIKRNRVTISQYQSEFNWDTRKVVWWSASFTPYRGGYAWDFLKPAAPDLGSIYIILYANIIHDQCILCCANH